MPSAPIGALVFLTLLIGGCALAPGGDALRAVIKEKGAQVYDQGLEDAEWFICYAASVGAVRRRYGVSAELAAAWAELCETTHSNILITSP